MVTFPINLRTKTPTFTSLSLGDEAIDTYDEGTWSPIAYLDTTDINSVDAGSVTYGRYTQIGDVVFFHANIQVNRGANTGTFTVGGLPFNSHVSNYTIVDLFSITGLDQAPTITATLGSGTNKVLFYSLPATTAATATQLTETILAASTEVVFHISGHYFV